MKLFKFGVVATVFGAALTFSGAASATAVTPTCSSIYHGLGTASEANGTKTLPATDIGTVVAGCQIGDLATNNVSNTGVFVSPSATPSIFQFEWDGGNLFIQEALGNNGTLGAGVDVELGILLGNSVNANGSLATKLASINFSAPFVVGGFQTLYSGYLNAGSYLIDTYSGTLAEDPTYQVNFTTLASIPEPLTLSMFGAGIFGVAVLLSMDAAKLCVAHREDVRQMAAMAAVFP